MSFSEYPPPTPLTSKNHRKWPWLAGAVVSGLVVVGLVNPMESKETTAQQPAVSSVAAPTTSTTTATSAAPAAPSTASITSESTTVPMPAADERFDDATTALNVLATVSIKGRAPKTGYDRDLFGQAWTDDVTVAGGRNGCDTRNDILRRDLTAVTLKSGSNGCAVQSGTLADAYTGTTINFVRGADTSSAVQIDHMVALSNAWQTGAQQLDQLTLRNLANDPRNLQAVDGPANQQKSDGDAATWLPGNKAYRCTYVARQVEVKAAYGLWVTQPEHEAITRVLGDCGGNADTVAEPVPPAESAPTPVEVAPAPESVPSNVTYKNCAAVRAAGAAPIRAGQPGFSTKFDGDGDGVGCE